MCFLSPLLMFTFLWFYCNTNLTFIQNAAFSNNLQTTRCPTDFSASLEAWSFLKSKKKTPTWRSRFPKPGVSQTQVFLCEHSMSEWSYHVPHIWRIATTASRKEGEKSQPKGHGAFSNEHLRDIKKACWALLQVSTFILKLPGRENSMHSTL